MISKTHPYLRLKSTVRIHPFENNTLLIKTPSRAIQINSLVFVGLLPKLCRFLDGSRSIEHILQSFTQDESLLVRKAIAMLRHYHLIEDTTKKETYSKKCSESYFQKYLDFFSDFRADHGGLNLFEKLVNSRIKLIGLNHIGISFIKAMMTLGLKSIHVADNKAITYEDVDRFIFKEADLRKPRLAIVPGFFNSLCPDFKVFKYEADFNDNTSLVDFVKDADIFILCGSFSPDFYERINKICLENSVKWTRASLYAMKGRIGPSVFPFITPCYTCYLHRLKINEVYFEEENILAEGEEGVETQSLGFPPFDNTLGDMLSWEVVRLITDVIPATSWSCEVEIDFSNLHIQLHRVLKLPRCPACRL